VRAHQAAHPITTLCRVLGVSASGDYAWTVRPASARATADGALSEQIRALHTRSRGTYGERRVHAELAAHGVHVGRKRITRLMRAMGLAGVSRRKATITTCRDQDARPAPDRVDRHCTVPGPDQLWVADITYIPTWAGLLYLAVVLDAWSRRVVGWAMATHLRTELVLDALNMAVTRRRPTNVIHHSDQGCQYTSIAFGRRCQEMGVRPSMGSVGDAYDNALCESFFRHARVRAPRPPSLPDAGRSAACRLRVPRGVVQPASSALRPRVRVPDQLREEPTPELIAQAVNRPPNRGQSKQPAAATTFPAAHCGARPARGVTGVAVNDPTPRVRRQ
jgi:putative transposase